MDEELGYRVEVGTVQKQGVDGVLKKAGAIKKENVKMCGQRVDAAEYIVFTQILISPSRQPG